MHCYRLDSLLSKGDAMNNSQLKFLAAVLLFLAWAGAIVAKHFWPDLETSGFVTAVTSTLAGLGIYHIKGTTS